VKSQIKSLVEAVAHLEARGTTARSVGNESVAEASFREALRMIVQELDQTATVLAPETLLDLLQIRVRLAVKCGDVLEAKTGVQSALASIPSIARSEEWSQFLDVGAWTDEWLIAAVRRDPPAAAALDVLADRYWKEVFGRCYLLTLNYDKASELAQQAWVRVLRARQRLLPTGNFPAYVSTVATNLWRDAQRWSRRAGPMAEQNLVSLDQPIWVDEGDNVLLADGLPSPNSLDAADRAMLRLDIDQSLERLSTKLRDVLISRYITGESSAEIAKRYGRTEQAVSGWIRDALQQMRNYLDERLPATSQRRKENYDRARQSSLHKASA
jgi:RNA polymerase sigma-70 factor (ECF subfamily)